MRLLDRYLLVEWLKVFGLTLAAMLGVVLVYEWYGNLGELLGDGASARQMAFFFAVHPLVYLPYVLPLSQFVSLLFVLGDLHRRHEIIALRAAGLSLWRIAGSLWAGGLVLAGALWWLNAAVVPWSVEQSRLLVDNLRLSAGKEGMIPQLTYDNQVAGRRWFINHLDEHSDRGYGVQVYESDAAGRDRRNIFAREGYYDDVKGDWVLEQGRELLFAVEPGADPATAQPQVVRSVYFDRREFPELNDDPALMRILRQRAADLSLRELGEALARVSARDNPALNAFAVQYQSILASPFVCLIVVGLAVPFAVAGVRVNPLVGVSKAVGLLFGYYVVLNVGAILGSQQTLPPLAAAWLPNLLMLAVAAWFFRRAG